MPVSQIDRLWFDAHPDREFRLRRQTPAELQKWPVPPRDGLTGWCVIREKDGATELFAFAPDETWCDCDRCLAPLSDTLRQSAA